jgi:hypothetical protein
MSDFLIQIAEDGVPVGYVGKQSVQLDRKEKRLLADYKVVQEMKDAMKYVSRGAAEHFAETFNAVASSGVSFRVVEVQAEESRR